ncbi:transferase hexapeptide repeat containing protein [Pedobacter sp. BAL39]|uniref:WcaF family extracellular polysaccharide biosynthesis acetyltransferase n=1 Tax=Pedobacter sp. BAL39 TaxID=391596 RepID=UPI00015594F2|nr:WcaF family extracellular polysaccharide biosynthesis acetyltransferase [Pedobacter sp. BAL39]EDM37139.1 transferase hexapeptide repeat containing protein [Pedobacter sp. BAL39]
MQQTDLSSYNHNTYHPGAGRFKRALWFFTSALLFKTSILPSSTIKVAILRLFGAKIGKQVVFRHAVNVKYPWHLTVGDHTWIGEKVWIDNLVTVHIGPNVCLSQGAMLLTGSHNYKSPAFDLITGSITLHEGCWVGARAILNQGIEMSAHAVLSTGSVATKNMEPYTIYQGNPALKVRSRRMSPSQITFA